VPKSMRATSSGSMIKASPVAASIVEDTITNAFVVIVACPNR